MHFLLHWLGLDNAGGPQYLFWSGIGLTMFWPLLWWRHHNCHIPRCAWTGHPDDQGVIYCRKHNPHKKEK